MSKHIQPISHYPPHERINLIKKKILKLQSLKSNTKDSAQSWRGAEVVEEGAEASQTIMWLLYLCIKPETSET